jgi:hypothetical protein
MLLHPHPPPPQPLGGPRWEDEDEKDEEDEGDEEEEEELVVALDLGPLPRRLREVFLTRRQHLFQCPLRQAFVFRLPLLLVRRRRSLDTRRPVQQRRLKLEWPLRIISSTSTWTGPQRPRTTTLLVMSNSR